MTVSESQRPRRTPAWIERLHPVPNPLVSLDQWYRLRHDDLAALPTHELLRQLRCVRYRLDVDPAPPDWLYDRQQAIRDELRRRER